MHLKMLGSQVYLCQLNGKRVQGKVLISHLRNASVPGNSSHPFNYNLSHGTEILTRIQGLEDQPHKHLLMRDTREYHTHIFFYMEWHWHTP